MARKIFKRFSIDRHKLLASGKLAALGDRIHDPNLWHLNRHSVSRAFFAGMFAGFAFLMFPGQMLVAATIAIWIRANLPISVGLVWLTNPFTSPPIIYAALKIGSWFIPLQTDFRLGLLLDYDWIQANLANEAAGFLSLLKQTWQPLLLGTFILGLALGTSSYFAVQLFWRWHVVRDWNARHYKRLRNQAS